MTLDEIKQSVGENWTAYYDGLTQEEAFNTGVECSCGQSRGVWYAGTAAEVPHLADKKIA